MDEIEDLDDYNQRYKDRYAQAFMHVICPNCHHDAGEMPSVVPGINVECFCGHKWAYEAITAPIPIPATPPPSPSIFARGFQKLQKSAFRKIFEQQLPKIFLKAASDGVITKDEENQIRESLAEHGISWDSAMRQLKPHTSKFAKQAFAEIIADGVITGDELAQLTRYIELFDIIEDIKPQAREFVRRLLADIVVDQKITPEEKKSIQRYVNFFNLHDLSKEIDFTLFRIEKIWNFKQGILPLPLPEKAVWLKSGEAIYFVSEAFYAKTLRKKTVYVPGKFYITPLRVEFVSENSAISCSLEKLRECEATSQSHLSLVFNIQKGSGVYIVTDAELIAAYVNCFAMALHRTVTIKKENSSEDERRRIPKEIRHEVWVRDGAKCMECNAIDYLEFDHIIPVTKGGSNSAKNIQLLCRRCNSKKSSKL